MKSRFVRWLLVTIAVVMVSAGSVYAYQALTGQGKVTVIENLSWVGANTFDVHLYPQESIIVSLTIANVSSIAMDITVTYIVTPDPKGLTVSIPNKLTVPANGQLPFNVTITASKSAEPISYSVDFGVDR